MSFPSSAKLIGWYWHGCRKTQTPTNGFGFGLVPFFQVALFDTCSATPTAACHSGFDLVPRVEQ